MHIIKKSDMENKKSTAKLIAWLYFFIPSKKAGRFWRAFCNPDCIV